MASRLALAVVLALVAGCGDGEPACWDCTLEERCFRDDRCHDGGCARVEVGCTSACVTQATCGEGHACVEQEDGLLCALDCSTELCGDRRECIGLACRDVECGIKTECLDGLALCDAWAHRCYPFDGRCGDADDCPVFDGRIEGIAEVSCEADYCRVAARTYPAIPGLDVSESVALGSPAPGDEVAAADDLVIRWSAVEGHSVVMVLAEVPHTAEAIAEHAIWGAVIPAGATRRAAVADGVRIVDGAWTDEPGALPEGDTLFVLVQVIAPGRLLAISELVPFGIGGGWPELGASCDDGGALPGSCHRPGRVVGCHPILGVCAAACLSSRDCEGGLECGEVRDGVRYCE